MPLFVAGKHEGGWESVDPRRYPVHVWRERARERRCGRVGAELSSWESRRWKRQRCSSPDFPIPRRACPCCGGIHLPSLSFTSLFTLFGPERLPAGDSSVGLFSALQACVLKVRACTRQLFWPSPPGRSQQNAQQLASPLRKRGAVELPIWC